MAPILEIMGQTAHRADILSITNALPCAVTTTLEHGYATRDFVRLTNLNGAKVATATPAAPHGSDPLNNYRFRIIVTAIDEFTLQHPITHEAIDSTNFPPYITGGFCNLIETNFQYNAED